MRADGDGSEATRIAVALILLRYCAWSPGQGQPEWRTSARDLMSQAVRLATAIVEQEPGWRTSIEQLSVGVEDWLEGYDPDAGPFRTKIFQHINLIFDALRLISDPGRRELLESCFRRADQLAEGAVYRGTKHYQGQWSFVDLKQREGEIRALASDDSAQARSLSRDFSRLYADVLENSFTVVS